MNGEIDRDVKKVLDVSWVLLLLQGLVALIFGIAVLVWPEITLSSLTIFFALFLVVTGVFDVVGTSRRNSEYDTYGDRYDHGVIPVCGTCRVSYRR